jgi:hypothetical protein
MGVLRLMPHQYARSTGNIPARNPATIKPTHYPENADYAALLP